MGIEILSPTLANQIAAGEVIERPASVVKELIENAIDAGSTRIDIDVEEAGIRKIQVIDNGRGIPADEVERAFERHATSKLYYTEDLFRIRTLGFRGEALPSIASVSECTIETSTGDEAGKRVLLRGGEIVESGAGTSRTGTTITVEQLFYNTPARLKHIKSLKTELAHIADVVNRSALAHPEIAFRFVHDGSVYMRTPGHGDLQQAVAGVYGVDTARKMIPFHAKYRDFEVQGLTSLPELTRAGRQYVTLIVNGRYVKSYVLTNALVNAYGSKLMIGRFPIAVIDIKLDPLLLDVNVHPTKQEIRISKEDELVALLKQAVSAVMNHETRIPHGLESIKQKEQAPEQVYDQESIFKNRNETEPSSSASPFPSQQSEWGEERIPSSFTSEATRTSFSPFGGLEELSPSFTSLTDEDAPPVSSLHPQDFVETAQKRLRQPKENQIEGFPQLDYIGQMHGTYLFAQNEEGFYMIDQHAAQERIKYEFYRKEIGERETFQQDLLVPLMLDYPVNDAILIKEKIDLLQESGLYVEPFGQNSFLVRSHPSWFVQGQEEATVKEMIDFVLEHDTLSIATFREATAIMMSCKRSIKANYYISDSEARKLLVDLAKAENPYNCPHGRPVMIQFTVYEIEKMFKRIQDR